jgi:hypothetical protein
MGFVALAGSPMYYDDFLERRIRTVEKERAENPEKEDRILIRRRSQWSAKMPDWKGPVFWFHIGDSKVFETVEKLNIYKKKIIDKAIKKGETNVKAVSDLFDKNIVEIPMPYYDDFKKNPEGSKRDLGGWPSDSITPFFENPEIIEERCNYSRVSPYDEITREFKSWFGPISHTWHAVHIDLALTGNACGIALGHNEGFNENGSPIHFIDCIVRLQGSPEEPVQIEYVRQLIYEWTKMGFMIGLVTMDGFQSADTMQLLAKKGYIAEYLSVDKDTRAYNELKTAIYEDRVDYYYHDVLIDELKKVERVRNKIDHPKNGSKDCADAVAGVVFDLVRISQWEAPDDDFEENQVITA